ncbi:GNAT family N-acetyltransferase [Bacillus sp. CGMCC 1.60114]|uniref:GNAT family N-acetyltransferase n=1 Tax=unclassified Bacillus (in: firmicutes) TaxID=185979 RepID=UPI0036257891
MRKQWKLLAELIFLEDRRPSWFEKNVEPTDGKHFYTLIYTNTDTPIGEVSFGRYDLNTKTAEFNIKIEYKHRGNGYAKEAICLLLEYYFEGFNGEIMIDCIAKNNISGQRVLQNFGFRHIATTGDAYVVQMKKEDFKFIKHTLCTK